MPEFIEIDWEVSALNCAVDGYGHHFATYDGEELGREGIYIFRTN